MRWMRAALLGFAALTACRFSFTGVDAGGDSSQDMAAPAPDLSSGGGGDLACSCTTGCGSTGACLALQPSGAVTAADYGLASLAAYNVTGNITINTDDGAIVGPPALSRPAGTGVNKGIGFHVVAQAGGPGVGVFSVAGLTVASGVKVTVTGGNAFALASSDAVTIDGLVDASCTGLVPGPGGYAGGAAGTDGSGPSAGAGKAGQVDSGGGAAGAASGGGGGAYGDAGGSGGLFAGQTTPNGGVPWGDRRRRCSCSPVAPAVAAAAR